MDRNSTVPGASISPEYIFKLWNLIIRPPRAVYSTAQLGATEFTVCGVRASRKDVTLRTVRGTNLVCSHFLPKQERRGQEMQKYPVIVYLHGNSSSRLEAGCLVSALIAQGFSLFCFDAAGCGLSEGDYISLGWHERDDLGTVLEHLREQPYVGPIGLWGRSMGAVTALLYMERDPAVSAICLDSPFANLRQLAEELAQSDRMAFPVPSWLVTAALAVIRMRVKALADFDIEDLVPLEHAKQSLVPAFFLHARQDTFISPSHTQQLFEAYAGTKDIISVEGDHNSERSEQVIRQAVAFFKRTFRFGQAEAAVPPVPPPLAVEMHVHKDVQHVRTPSYVPVPVPVQTMPAPPLGTAGAIPPSPAARLAPRPLTASFKPPLGGSYTAPPMGRRLPTPGPAGAVDRACSQPRDRHLRLGRAARGGG